jgi:thiamine pyrophosphokinase
MPAQEVDANADAGRAPRDGGPMQVIVVASGALDPADAAWLDGADLVIAADGGADRLLAFDRRPDRVVGDLDSIDPATLAALERVSVPISRHPRDKEASDTELALGEAREAGATSVVMLGALGGQRLDHELANLLLLADPDLAALDVACVRGPTVVHAARGGGSRVQLRGTTGDLVTLLPLGDDAAGVRTSGLRWPLDHATLRVGRSRGLSNVVEEAPASVQLETGTLLIIETASEGDSAP